MQSTHEVTNQPPPLVGHDVFATDRALVEAVRRYGPPGELSALGRLAGSEQPQRWAVQANAHPPLLRTTTGTGAASTRWNSIPPGTP